MYTLFTVLIVLASILMILIVLIQEPKGGGLASNFSSSNAIMGVRKTTDVVEKTTWALAAAMVILSVFCAYVAPTGVREQSVLENATQAPATPQGYGTGQTTAPASGNQKAAPASGNQKAAPAANGSQQAPTQGTQAPAQGAPAQAQ